MRIKYLHKEYCNSTKKSEIALYYVAKNSNFIHGCGSSFVYFYRNVSSDNKQALIAGLGVALLLANITYFKFRKRQFVVNRIAIIVAFVLEAIIIYPLLTTSEYVSSSQLNYTLVSPLVSVIFCSLANRAIQRDEKKVNSSDRFR